MPSEIREAVKSAADDIAKYIKEAAMMTVETRYVEMGTTSFDQSELAARTIIKLDGDSETVMPMRKNEMGALEVDAMMFELHQQNVQTAIDYRARILNSLLGILQSVA